MSNPRRVTRSGSGSGSALTLKTDMVLRKGATFHSPTSPSSSTSDSAPFTPPSLVRRSQTNLDDVVDAHRRRVALTLGNITKSLAASNQSAPSVYRDDVLAVPRVILDHTIMSPPAETERRVLRPRINRRPARYHESDSGLGTSIATSKEKRAAAQVSPAKENKAVGAVTRSAASTTKQIGLSPRATNRIYEHTLKPLLAKTSLKEFHPLVLEVPQKIQKQEIVCLRDIEKTLLLIAPEKTKVSELYLEFCLTAVQCLQATVEFLTDRELTRPSDNPYTNGYFINLVDQIHQYAQQLADAKEKKASDEDMDIDSSDEIKLHGGITINGRPAELVRVKKDGKAVSIATGLPVELDEDVKDHIRVKRSASEQLADDEEIMRSMARRKKNAPPEEYAPKKCREPGCNKEFKRPCDLTKHEKTHSRPWKCPDPVCKYHDYGWPTEKERDRHVNDKHQKNPTMFECKFKPCPYKSKRESNCKQHMEKAHGWQYNRTKTNGTKPRTDSVDPSLPTPNLHAMPTPPSDGMGMGVPTPPQDYGHSMFPNIEFPTYLPGHMDIPQEIHLDYSPVDQATPSTDSSMDHNSAYQDMSGQDFQLFDDIYAAPVQIQTRAPLYTKEMVQDFLAFSAAELSKTEPAPHISPTGHGNAMLFTPNSLAEVDEGFEDFPAATTTGADFVLFPQSNIGKPAVYEGLFDEVPSLVAGYSQPNSQTLMPTMDWQQPSLEHAHAFAQY